MACLRIVTVTLFALLCALVLPGAAQQPAANRPVVLLVPVDGTIDLGLAPYVQRVLKQAQDTGAAAVVLEINTFGGRLDAATQIRDHLLGTPVRTIAFVNRRAISAGALIGLAAGTIAMAGGSTIGAATPVQAGQPGDAAAPVGEKTVSYVRKEFAATAESRKRPIAVAEAMVDPDVAIPGVIEKGKLLTLSTDEALRLKLADFRADSLEQLLQQAGLGGAEVRRIESNWAENIVRFLTHPVVSSLLITMAMLGIVVELRTPGFGLAGLVGVGSLGLFFWGHFLVQLAGWEELLLVAVGVVLLALELLVIPGFGIAGVAGLVALAAGFILATTGAGATAAALMLAATRVVFALIAAIVLGLLSLRFLGRLPVGRKLVLETGLDAQHGYQSAPDADRRWLGRRGVAMALLHPAGYALIDGQRVDVVSEGEPVDAGAAVEVVRVDGNRIVVRRVDPLAQQRSDP